MVIPQHYRTTARGKCLAAKGVVEEARVSVGIKAEGRPRAAPTELRVRQQDALLFADLMGIGGRVAPLGSGLRGSISSRLAVR